MNFRLQAMLRRLSVFVILPSGAVTKGMYDKSTKAEHIGKADHGHVLVGTPSVLLETVEGLGMDDPLTVDGRIYYVRDFDAQDDGATTRYFLGAER